jgi:hypothetical protein
LTREALLDELAKEPNRSGSTERHPSTKFFGLWKSFFKKIFALAIPTAQKNFCQVAELLMPREWCRKRGSAAYGKHPKVFCEWNFSRGSDNFLPNRLRFLRFGGMQSHINLLVEDIGIAAVKNTI